MKFLKEDGTVDDGTPLTDRQVDAIERFTEYLHENLCDNSFHGSYGKKRCRDAANDLIPKLDDSAVWSLCTAMSKPEPAPVCDQELIESVAEKEISL